MIREIAANELSPLIERGAVIVDVREPDEYLEGHVPGAVNVPLASVPDNLDTFRRPVPVYVVCHSGGRSMRACEYLVAQGIDAVVNVAGGTSGFASLGNALTGGPNP
jgi:rhodanese-related sulfurtransferase